MKTSKIAALAVAVFILIGIIAVFICVFGGRLPASRRTQPPAFNCEKVDISIPGIKRSYSILWVSDLHIAKPCDEVDEASRADVLARYEYSNHSADSWPDVWPEMINNSGADLVIFGGDMADFCSASNLAVLKAGLDKIRLPYIYIRADHDLLHTYMTAEAAEAASGLQDSLAENRDLMSREFEDFTVAAWNNSTSDISPEGLEEMRRICAAGKPVILVTHVPIAPAEDKSLAEASRTVFSGRSLLWGYNDDYYWPEADTRAFLDLIYGEASPVTAVFCGHLHFSWDGSLTPTCREHVFSAALDGSYGLISITP